MDRFGLTKHLNSFEFKGSKVLRTRKINISSTYIQKTIWSYFCNNNCLFSFLNQFRQQVANLNPTTEPSETPIDVKVENRDSYRLRWNDGGYERVPHVEKVKTSRTVSPCITGILKDACVIAYLESQRGNVIGGVLNSNRHD